MKWCEMTKEEAQAAFEQYKKDKKVKCPEDYKELREDLSNSFKNALTILKIEESELKQKNNSYQLDLMFGLRIYDVLNNKYGFNIRLAATDGIWRYLAVVVVPDLTDKRYDKDEHPDRFWKKPKRIWLRVLWWYIYLSWQGTEKDTYLALKDNSTDEILQMVDRCGHGGYRTELYREVIRQYSLLEPAERRKKSLFRKMFVLNTARTQVIEPALSPGGNVSYVRELINYFE